ncbi:Gfo/Idh/MocA family protein [Gracilibacillus sp. HCP3S3_G5_1]|uniref:Gfo/Idh/MocA family protein n=1 Tax=unclassified Gracilibacillus TaxID=2625209 RepID=UPI003F89ECCE
MLKVAVIGLGKMGQRHAEVWDKLENTKIVGLIGRDKSKLSPLTQKWNAAYFPDLKSLLKQEHIDVLDICLPTFLHYETIKAAIQMQEHISIICEKPLCLNVEEAKEIEELSRQKSVQVLVGHILRFDQEYSQLRIHVQERAVGEVGVVRLSRKTSYPSSWFSNHEKSNGIIMDLGIHDLDWLLWTFGDVERVMARHIIQTEERSFEYALITLRMKNGVIAHLELSWGADSLQTSAEIAGNEGLLVASSDNKEGVHIQIPNVDKRAGYLSADLACEPPIQIQLRHFRDCILEGKTPIITLNEAVQSIKIAEAAITSANLGQVIYVEERSQ